MKGKRVLQHSGTAFAISSTRAVTCYHNIEGHYKDSCFLVRSVGTSVTDKGVVVLSYPSDAIQLQYVGGSSRYDWAVFKRCDEEEFADYVTPCPLDKLPAASTDNKFTIYFAPLGLLVETLPEVKVWKGTTLLMQYESELPTATFECGKVRGCSGSPVVDGRGYVIGFLTESLSEAAIFKAADGGMEQRLECLESHSSISGESNYASYISVLVICRVRDLWQQLFQDGV